MPRKRRFSIVAYAATSRSSSSASLNSDDNGNDSNRCSPSRSYWSFPTPVIRPLAARMKVSTSWASSSLVIGADLLLRGVPDRHQHVINKVDDQLLNVAQVVLKHVRLADHRPDYARMVGGLMLLHVRNLKQVVGTEHNLLHSHTVLSHGG